MINNIEISCYDIKEPEWINSAGRFCDRILTFLGIEKWEVSVVFTGNEYIRELNRDFREKDSPTDVLSFCQIEGGEIPLQADGFIYAGDIIVSIEFVKENSVYFGVSEVEEIQRQLIHGMLHLKGLDHKTNNSDEEMIKYQEEILNKIGEKW